MNLRISMGRNNETNIVSEILNKLNNAPGVFVWRQNTTGRMVKKENNIVLTRPMLKGIPDIIGYYYGRFLCVEIKTAKGQLSVDQKAFLKKAIKDGGIGIVGSNWQEVARSLIIQIKSKSPLDGIGLLDLWQER
jgi:hypothetical protein